MADLLLHHVEVFSARNLISCWIYGGVWVFPSGSFKWKSLLTQYGSTSRQRLHWQAGIGITLLRWAEAPGLFQPCHGQNLSRSCKICGQRCQGIRRGKMHGKRSIWPGARSGAGTSTEVRQPSGLLAPPGSSVSRLIGVSCGSPFSDARSLCGLAA